MTIGKMKIDLADAWKLLVGAIVLTASAVIFYATFASDVAAQGRELRAHDGRLSVLERHVVESQSERAEDRAFRQETARDIREIRCYVAEKDEARRKRCLLGVRGTP